MSHNSLAAAPLSDNDVWVLATLFEVSIEYFRTHHSPQAKDFIRDLRTLAGLGFTAALADDGGIVPYQSYLNQFLEAERGDFMQARHRPASVWGTPLSNMMIWSLGSFRRLGYPGYYRDFTHHLEKILKNVRMDLTGKRKEANRILLALPYRN